MLEQSNRERSRDYTSTMKGGSMKEQLCANSPLWAEAAALLERQEALQRLLRQYFESKPASGLYRDEAHERIDASTKDAIHNVDLDAFRCFVRHLRKILSRSPRTVIRQALTVAFETLQQRNGETFQELQQILAIQKPPHKTLIYDYVDAIEQVPQGKCFDMVQKLRQQLATAPLHVTNLPELEAKIRKGLGRKMKTVPSPELVATVVAKAIAKEDQRRDNLRSGVERWEAKMVLDKQYRHYEKVQRLWSSFGGKELYARYREVQLAICRSRIARGSEFESLSSEVCFAMIVLKHVEHRQKQQKQSDGICADERNQISFSFDSFHFEQNLRWWKDGKDVGEIDLVVFDSNLPIAICEMKSSTFEIARAPKQHQEKLDAVRSAVSFPPHLSPPRDAASEWRIGKTWDGGTCVNGRDMGFHISTLLPDGDDEQIGADPHLAHATCKGTCSQKVLIAHPSTFSLCGDISDMLLKGIGTVGKNGICGEQSCFDTEAVVSAVRSVPPMTECDYFEEVETRDTAAVVGRNCKSNDCQQSIDYLKLATYVRREMKPGELQESPFGCFRRLQSSMLIFPRKHLPSKLESK